MKITVKTTLSAAGVTLAALTAGSFALASYSAGGRRQTLQEARAWQEEHTDISWYAAMRKEDYTVSSYDGYILHAQLVKCPEDNGRYVILSHGYTDNRYGNLKYMKIYLDAGYHCITYDLRGHGENKKTFCTYSIREAKDLHRMIEDTRRRYGQDIVLGLHGESLGAATTAAVLQYDQDLAFAVCDCGFSDITNVFKVGLKAMHLPSWLVYSASAAASARYGYSFSDMRPVDALKENTVPILFMHGEKDDFIVPANSERMQKATAGYSELHLIPDAGHAQSVLTHPELYADTVISFLQNI